MVAVPENDGGTGFRFVSISDWGMGDESRVSPAIRLVKLYGNQAERPKKGAPLKSAPGRDFIGLFRVVARE